MAAQYCSNSNKYSTEKLFLLIRNNQEMYRIQMYRINLLLQEGVDIDARDSNGRTPLLLACWYRRKRIAMLLISAGANVDICDEKKFTALHYASDNGWTKIVRSLAKKVRDLDARDIRGETPLHIASKLGRLKMVKSLLNAGADIDPKNIVNYTPLVCSAELPNKAVFDLLLECGAKVDGFEGLLLYFASQNDWTDIGESLLKRVPDLNERYVIDETDLSATSSRRHLEVLQSLMGEGTNIDTRNEIIGRAALRNASGLGDLEVVRWLVKRVSDLNKGDHYGETALYMASNEGDLEIVKCLVEGGADINIKDEDGDTALFIACTIDDLELVKYLVEKGTAINTRNEIGWTAFHEASERGHLEVVKYLVEKGADINVQSFDGDTPLLCAARSNCKDVVDLLMDLGANGDGSILNGRTMMHWASTHGWTDILKSLVKGECDLEAKTVFGMTALYCACINKKLHAVQFLLQAGASWDTSDEEGISVLDFIIEEEMTEFLKLFIENGAYLDPLNHDPMVNDSLLEVLQDVKLCCEVIVNKFNNYSLPELYKLTASESLPRIEKMKISKSSEVAQTIERTVIFEIHEKGYCDVLNVRPIVLSVLSVGSILQSYENKKSEPQNSVIRI